MNVLLEMLNIWGSRFVQFAWPMLIQSSLLIAALLGLNWALRRHARSVFRYSFLLLILVKLMLPASAFPTGLGYWFPFVPLNKIQPAPTIVSDSAASTDINRTSMGMKGPPPALSGGASMMQVSALPTSLTWSAVLFCVWLAGVAALVVIVLRRSRQVARLRAGATEAQAPLQTLFHSCGEQLRVRWKVRIMVSNACTSPAVCGLLRPIVLVPIALADELSASQMRAVILHELGHIKRGDLVVNHLQVLMQVFYWYQPLLWLANAVIRRTREEAVDEMVMVEMSPDAECYPSTLLTVAKLAYAQPVASLGLLGIAESKRGLKERLQRLVTLPIPKTYKVGVGGALILAVFGGLLLPMSGPARAQTSNDTPVNAQTASRDAANQQTPRSSTTSSNLDFEVQRTIESLKAYEAVMQTNERAGNAEPEVKIFLASEADARFRNLSNLLYQAELSRANALLEYTQVVRLGTNVEALMSLPSIVKDPKFLEAQTSVTRLETEFSNFQKLYRDRHPKYIEILGDLEQARANLTNVVLQAPERLGVTLVQAMENALVLRRAYDAEKLRRALSIPEGGQQEAALNQARQSSASVPPPLERSQPSIFQLRLVFAGPSADAEPMTQSRGTNSQLVSRKTYYVQKAALLDQMTVQSASVQSNDMYGYFDIRITFTDEGAKTFAEVTRQNVHRQLAIVIDGQLLSAPVVNEPILGGNINISGDFTEQQAIELTRRINEAANARDQKH